MVFQVAVGSFRGWLWVVEGVVADHGVQGQDAAVGQAVWGVWCVSGWGVFLSLSR